MTISVFTQSILACPKCLAHLRQIQECKKCGEKFKNEGGIPRLTSRTSSRTFNVSIAADQISTPDELIGRVFRDPPIPENVSELPYHMDKAHFLAISKIKPGSKVIEIGCGGGQNRQFFIDLGFDYVGIDISKERVFDWLQEYGGPDYICDAHYLPFLDESFDLVYCAAVFEHLSCPDLAVSEVHRVLKSGGVFLGNVSFLEPWHDDSYYHMTPLGVIKLLQRGKLQVEYVWPGRGYSVFSAVSSMASRSIKLFKWLFMALYRIYRLEYKLKSIVKGTSSSNRLDIINRAEIAGATDWIATKPVVGHNDRRE